MGETILVVDDDLEMQRTLTDALEAAGYRVSLCDNGNRVAECIRECKPALLLLDVMLPGTDGYTLAMRLSEDEATSRLPIIVLSGLEPSRGMFSGFPQVAGFLSKPFEYKELLDLVGKALAP